MPDVHRNSKDSIFCDLFSRPKYQRMLVQALGVADDSITEEDIRTVTIENVMVRGIYNDVGLQIRDQFIILIEEQSTWSYNILIRMLAYFTTTVSEMMQEQGISLYRRRKAPLPKPKFFVVYGGSEKDVPQGDISLQYEFFGGEKTGLELSATVLSSYSGHNILAEYLQFCKLFNQKVLGPHRNQNDIAREIVETCISKGILREYFQETQERKVVGMIANLYDEAYWRRIQEAEEAREAEQKEKEHKAAILKARQDAKAEGQAEGESRLANLVTALLAKGRTDDVAKATSDTTARQKFYEEFGI